MRAFFERRTRKINLPCAANRGEWTGRSVFSPGHVRYTTRRNTAPAPGEDFHASSKWWPCRTTVLCTAQLFIRNCSMQFQIHNKIPGLIHWSRPGDLWKWHSKQSFVNMESRNHLSIGCRTQNWLLWWFNPMLMEKVLLEWAERTFLPSIWT